MHRKKQCQMAVLYRRMHGMCCLFLAGIVGFSVWQEGCAYGPVCYTAGQSRCMTVCGHVSLPVPHRICCALRRAGGPRRVSLVAVSLRPDPAPVS